jgi:uncharacterized membrane protein
LGTFKQTFYAKNIFGFVTLRAFWKNQAIYGMKIGDISCKGVDQIAVVFYIWRLIFLIFFLEIPSFILVPQMESHDKNLSDPNKTSKQKL